MKSTSILALVATAFLLLAPVAHAEQEKLFHPRCSSIMAGFNFPANEDFEGGSECLFVERFMVNQYLGWQIGLGGVAVSDDNDNGGTFYDIAASFKLALPVAFIEPYILGGAGVGYEGPHWRFPVHAAVGIDFNFGKVLVGAEARQVWLEVDGRDYDALLRDEQVRFPVLISGLPLDTCECLKWCSVSTKFREQTSQSEPTDRQWRRS